MGTDSTTGTSRNGRELRTALRSLRSVQAGWAFGVPEDGHEQWLDEVTAAVEDWRSADSTTGTSRLTETDQRAIELAREVRNQLVSRFELGDMADRVAALEWHLDTALAIIERLDEDS